MSNTIQSLETYSPERNSDNWITILVGIWLGFCSLGLIHDTYALYVTEEQGVEQGEGMDVREDFEKDVREAPIGRQLGFIGLWLAGTYCFLTVPRGGRFGSLAVFAPTLCFFLWSCASAYWSIDRPQTLRELFRIVVYIFVATSLVRRFEARNVIKAIAICLLLSISTCYVGELAIGIFRPWSSDFRMHGTIHASALAHQCLVVCLAASSLALNSSRKNVWRAILIFALITLVFSKTRGALFATLLGMASIQMLRFKVITNMIIGTGIVTLFAGLLFLSEMSGPKLKNQIGNAASLGRSEGVSTLTGRLPLWRVLWRESRHDRVIGVGYGAFFTTKRTNALARELQWFPGHSHNAYFETVLDLGYAGLCILFWLVAATFVEAVRLCNASRNYAYAFVASLMVAGLLDGVVEVMFVSVRELGLFVGMAITMLFLYHPFDMRQAVEPMKNRVF